MTLWTPPGRTPRQVRHARVKVVGSLLLIALILVAFASLLPRGAS